MAEKRKLLQQYMTCLNKLEDELKRKELEKQMRELEVLQSELARRQERKNVDAAAGGLSKEQRLKVQRKLLGSFMQRLDCLMSELERREALLNGEKGHPSESENLPHPSILKEYTIAFSEVDEGGRELLEAALAARKSAYVPYSNFKVGAAFRSKCGRIYTGCNIENVAFTPSNCAERCALAKGISEGELKYIEGAVVAYHPDGFTTPCGVCRQFIREFAYKDFPIYIAKAPPPEMECSIPAIQDADEVLVTSAYNLLPHSFTTFV